MPARRARVLGVTTFLVTLESLAASGVLAPMAREFSAGVGSAGQVTTLFTLSAAIAVLPLSYATRRVPKRGLLTLAMAVQSAVNIVIV